MKCEDLFEAYYACRKNKRRTVNAMKYEVNMESNLIALLERVNDRTYHPSQSTAFIVTRPRLREVFAANFEDRIIHHYIALRVEPLFEAVFNDRTFNCRKGKGTKYGVDRLTKDMYDCSEGYTKDCYAMKLDLKGFFMSIDKRLLWSILQAFLVDKYRGSDVDELLWLVEVVLMHDPEKDCVKRSSPELWEQLPANKSLFTNGEGMGLPIGNLPSQLFANFLLNSLDWYMEEIGVKYHGRYVDDIYLLHERKEVLLDAVQHIRTYARDRLHVSINEKKTSLQHYSKGIQFTGVIVKPGRRYVINRIAKGLNRSVERLRACCCLSGLFSLVQSANSYLGQMRSYNTYGIRRRTLHGGAGGYVYIQGHFDRIKIKKSWKIVA